MGAWERLAEIFPRLGENREKGEKGEKGEKAENTLPSLWGSPRRRLSRPVLALVGDVTIYGVRFSVE